MEELAESSGVVLRRWVIGRWDKHDVSILDLDAEFSSGFIPFFNNTQQNTEDANSDVLNEWCVKWVTKQRNPVIQTRIDHLSILFQVNL